MATAVRFALASAAPCGHHRPAMSMTDLVQSEGRWLRLGEAAGYLGLTACALRARLSRGARTEAGQLVSRPGLGVEGRKIGAHWRVRVLR